MMEKPDKRIRDFITEHHVLTLATSQNGQPWCANCFYAYHEDENVLIFTSDDETRHIQEALANKQVAASIVLETSVVGKIRGLQMTGKLELPEGELAGKVKKRYLKKFPYAALMETKLWVLNIESMKMTDNRLGFGKKLFWPS
ncbi:UPF0306 protein [Prolixibacter bellariivorans]|uniref:UPF0306 protein n=2 Tax=Prolixibacter bellariivorans TaxID=314319 RepID=A0A5M4AYL0_9BACT|nr:pyridoxamine 5'-phosphate oxidase family protein [Prolixibacter bellariivorans]GET32854.1 UPF0306 protein [Prolixibacter bellariivorans]